MSNLHLGDPAIIKVHGKRSRRRDVYLTTKTKAALEAWLAVRPTNDGEGSVFVTLDRNTYGRPISPRSISRMVDGYLEDLGLKEDGISCHSLRHSAATWALAGGADERAIQDVLGHADPRTTQVYAQIVNRMEANPALVLEDLLGG